MGGCQDHSRPSGSPGRPLSVPWPRGPALLFAFVLAMATLSLRGVLPIAFGQRPLMILMLVPVIVAAYAGGFWPGVLATAIVATGGMYFFMPPVMGFGFRSSVELLQWTILVLTGLLISAVLDDLHRAARRLEAARGEQEQTAERLQDVLANARCILWHATVRAPEGWDASQAEPPGNLDWELSVHDEATAQRVLPLRTGPALSYTDAWRASRAPEHLPAMRQRLRQALQSGAAEYEQSFPCVDCDGHERWLQERVGIRQTGPQSWDLVGVCTDITARLAEAEVMRAVLTHARCILWEAEVSDPVHGTRVTDDLTTELGWQPRIVDVEAAQQVLPLDTVDEEYLGCWLAHRDPDDRRMTDRVGREAILAGQPGYEFEYRCTDRFGELHWLHETTTVVPAGPGRWRAVGVCTDVTDRRAAEDELRIVLTNARCILWTAAVSDPMGDRRPPDDTESGLRWETRIADEHAALQVLPLALRDGESFRFGFHRCRHADDKRRTDAAARRAILAGERGYDQEFRCLDRHGQERWLREEVVIHPAGPHNWQVYGVTTDITQQKQAIEELRAVLTHARCILWRAEVTSRPEPGGKTALVWQTAIADLGAAMHVLPLDLLEGEGYLHATLRCRDPEHRAIADAVVRPTILASEPGYDLEYRCVDRHGRAHWMHEEATIVPDGPDRWRVFGVCTDVTALKEAEAEVRALNVQLEQRVAERTAELLAANQELEGFAYAVSHDLRAPLRAMSGFSNALMEDYLSALPDEAQVYLDQIAKASRQMGALIDGVLVLSRATRGELHRDRLDLSAMATRILDELATQEPDRAVDWQVESGLRARGDGRMIEAVLRNLLGNAFKYTEKTLRAMIRVRGRRSNAESWIEVEDNGAGFDEAHAEKLFQPFQRLHRQDEFPGLGIGLATAQRIIRRHGGQLEAHGEVGQGATFAFTLPEASDESETEDGPPHNTDR